MSQISFQEDNDVRQRRSVTKATTMGWLVKKGLAPNERVASLMLLGIAVTAMVLGVYVFNHSSKNTLEDIDPKIIQATWPGAKPPIKAKK